MRREDRKVSELSEIVEIVDRCKVFRLAMVDDGKPYLVALNFGYTFENGELVFYFHSATRGRKIDILTKNPSVCFELDCSHGLVDDEIPCRIGFLYESVVGTGTVEFLEDKAEKIAALNRVLLHQAGKTYEMDERMVGGVALCRLRAETVCGKARRS